MLSSPNYDAFEANGTVSICAVIMAEAIETTVNVQFSSQDSTARSKNDNTVVGKRPWMLKHNSRFWPGRDIFCIEVQCYIDPLKCAIWALTREWALAQDSTVIGCVFSVQCIHLTSA